MTQTTEETNLSKRTTLFNTCATGLKLALNTALKDCPVLARPKQVDIAIYCGPTVFSVPELLVSSQSRAVLICGTDYEEGQAFSGVECKKLLNCIWRKVQLTIHAGLLVSEGEMKGSSSGEPAQMELQLGVIFLENKRGGVRVQRYWSMYFSAESI